MENKVCIDGIWYMLNEEKNEAWVTYSDDEEETPYEELTDEEKDARDYQLQRAMDMVIAMSKLQNRTQVSEEKTESDKE